MTVKAVIFDLDGTLLDTLADLADAGNAMLAEYGFSPLAKDSYRLLVGSGARVMVERAIAASGGPVKPAAQLLDKMVKSFHEHYEKHWHDLTRPYPGITDLVAELCHNGLPMAVLSNKPDVFTRAVIDWYFPGQPFVQVRGVRKDSEIKPDPAVALAIALELKVDPSSVVFVGDAATDMGTAVNAGMRPYGVLWGFRDAAELKTAGAVRLFATPASLKQQLLSDSREDS